MRITLYARGKRIHLINIGEQLLTPEALRERLPQLALEAVHASSKKD
jgi:hypothetical protein